MNAKIFVSLATAFVLTACSGEKSNTSTNSGVSKYVCTGGGEVMNGYKLPPCPDQSVNDSTLLGIDSNDNGVRDDVEVWIYHKYDTHASCTRENVNNTLADGRVIHGVKETCDENVRIPYHQIVREIAMQWARASQIVIQEPERARETTKYEDDASDCQWYFQSIAKYFNEPTFIDEHNNELYKELDNVQFNTIQRARAYGKYNFHLSGGAYPSTPYKELRSKCDFDVDTLLEK